MLVIGGVHVRLTESLIQFSVSHLELRVRGHVSSGTLGPMSSDKSSLRKQCKAARNALSNIQQADNSHALCHALEAYLDQLPPQRIAAYFAFGAEISIDPLFTKHPRHQWFAPIITPEYGMKWGTADPSQLIHNEYGIREPSELVKTSTSGFDIMLLPLVGFDLGGNRIGMGAGYYDRALGQLQEKPILIGCAHGVQECQSIAAEPWDVRLDAIATEKGLIWLN